MRSGNAGCRIAVAASPSFAEAANSVAPGALASSTMGDYTPRRAYCEKAVFEAGGYAACDL